MIHIFTHCKPDADAFGSAIGLAEIQSGFAYFREEDWANRPASIRALEEAFGGFGCVRFFDPGDRAPEGDLIVVDCGDPSRISAPKKVLKAGFIQSFDHHINEKVAMVENGSVNAPAAAAVIARVFSARLNPLSASLLYAGLAGDTAGFSNAAATEEAFEVAALLLRRGAKSSIVNSAITAMTMGRAKLEARFLASLRQEKFMVVVNTTVLTHDDFSDAGATRADYAGMPSVALSVAKADLSASIIEDKTPGVWAIAFRSRTGTGAAKECAVAFGGNGHPDAAGGTIKADTAEEAREKTIEKLRSLIMV